MHTSTWPNMPLLLVGILVPIGILCPQALYKQMSECKAVLTDWPSLSLL